MTATSAEGQPVDRFKHLARPPPLDASHLGQQLPGPAIEIQEPRLLVIGLTGLMVFTAHDDIALAIK
jgi:hypothetical protein